MDISGDFGSGDLCRGKGSWEGVRGRLYGVRVNHEARRPWHEPGQRGSVRRGRDGRGRRRGDRGHPGLRRNESMN